jgi:hypothetical protein
MTQRRATPDGEKQWLGADGYWYPTESDALATGVEQAAPTTARHAAPVAPPPLPPPVSAPAYGSPPPNGEPRHAAKAHFNGTAIAAFVFAILFWPVGIILGHVARHQIRRDDERGGGLALAGLIISYIWGAAVIALVVVAVATHHGTGSGPSQASLQNAIKSDASKEDVTGVSSVSCAMPNSWTQGTTFNCFAYNSSGHGLATVQVTVLADSGGAYRWNETWS